MFPPPKKHTIHDENIRELKPFEPLANQRDNHGIKYEESHDEEEPLGVMTEVIAIILLVAVHGLLAFFDQHSIDFSDSHLCLVDYPFSLLVEQVLHLLPISIRDIDQHL